ncbi:hypothetical protein SAMN04515619_11066 [Collimonas sp. OK412]|jgi:hypothetical protein|nr:hypothetical protein SAMN04515619_11066 [Collimonas sp. OK412]
MHILLLFMATRPVMSGQHLRQNAQLVQMTLYVGVGEAKATASVPSPAALPVRSMRPISVDAGKTRPGSGSIGEVTPKAGEAERGTDLQDELPSTFLPSSEMDFGAVPVSEPDSHFLVGVKNSGSPIRLRLYVDKYGVVKDIHVLQADDMDGLAVEHLVAMFYATTFIPARREGVDMSSYMDIELNITDFTSVSSAPVTPPQRR